MEWSITAEKEASLQQEIDGFMGKKVCTLKEIQKILGKLSNFAQMCDLLRSFKFSLLLQLRKFEGCENRRKLISKELKDDLWVWKKAISEARTGIPIRNIFDEPPLSPETFMSDAAGAAFEWENGSCKNVSEKGDRGVASVGHIEGKVTRVALIRWPENLLSVSKNRNGKFFGSLSATLEAVGLLLPFLTVPAGLRGKHVLLEVDNSSVVYAWEKKHGKTDFELTLLIRCLVMIEIYLECKIHVKHVKRRSNGVAELVDNLSREKTSGKEVMDSLEGVEIRRVGGHLGRWLEDPKVDWDLPLKLIEDVKKEL
jgi:hypothetical protein